MSLHPTPLSSVCMARSYYGKLAWTSRSEGISYLHSVSHILCIPFPHQAQLNHCLNSPLPVAFVLHFLRYTLQKQNSYILRPKQSGTLSRSGGVLTNANAHASMRQDE